MRFRKNVDLTEIGREAELAKLAHEFFNGYPSFYAPDVQRVSLSEGFIEFEFLGDVRRLSSLLGTKKFVETAYSSAARCLVALHQGFQPSVSRERSSEIDTIPAAGPDTFLHGDFTIDNVLWHLPTKRIVVVDWSSAPWLNESANYGSALWDVTWMVQSIFMLHPLNVLAVNRHLAAKVFTEQYCKLNVGFVDLRDVGIYGIELSRKTIEMIDSNIGLSRPLMIYGVRRFEKFCRQLLLA